VKNQTDPLPNSREYPYLERINDLALASPRKSRIVYNLTLDVKTIDLEGNKYCDVQGNKISGNVTLPPFESKILISANFVPPAPALPYARQKSALRVEKSPRKNEAVTNP
jgi:hypothetical protein